MGCDLTGTDTLSVVALPEETVDTADGECETGLGGTAVTEANGSVRDRVSLMSVEGERTRQTRSGLQVHDEWEMKMKLMTSDQMR